MNAVLPALLAAAASIAALPVAADAPAAARDRIAAERSSVEAQYQGEERACWGRFAVNDCLAEARTRRRSSLADLRRQEISLNDAQRKQRAAERLRSIEQRSAPVAPAASPAKIRDGGDRAGRDATAAQRVAEQAAREAERARRTNAKPRADGAGRVSEELTRRESERAQRAERAAANVQRREALQQQARERQEALQRRLAERHKPPAAPLPVPP